MSATITERLRALGLADLRGKARLPGLLDRVEETREEARVYAEVAAEARQERDALRGTVEQLTADLVETRRQRDEARRLHEEDDARHGDEQAAMYLRAIRAEGERDAARAEMAALDADRGAVARDLLAARAEAEALSAELRALRRDLHVTAPDAVAGLAGAHCVTSWQDWPPADEHRRESSRGLDTWERAPSQRCAPVALPVPDVRVAVGPEAVDAALADPDRVEPQPQQEAGRWQWPPGAGWVCSSPTTTMDAPRGGRRPSGTMRRGADGVWRWVR